MSTILNCPGCGFRGKLPESMTGVQSIGCPQCHTVIPIDQLPPTAPASGDASPICVDGGAGLSGAIGLPAAVMPLGFPAPTSANGDYSGDYMRDEAVKFAQYTTQRLGELHRKRMELAEAESRFEAMCVSQKQTIHDQRMANAARANELSRREAELQAKVSELNTIAAEYEPRAAELDARETQLAAWEADLAAREARVARPSSRETTSDRRVAELRAAIEQLEARRAALAEERAALDQRAEMLDRTELALHRRSAELDEMDERLRLEQEEWERMREEAEAAQEPAG
jgi:hypothetical protein